MPSQRLKRFAHVPSKPCCVRFNFKDLSQSLTELTFLITPFHILPPSITFKIDGQGGTIVSTKALDSAAFTAASVMSKTLIKAL